MRNTLLQPTLKTATPALIDLGMIQNILTEMMQNDVLPGLPRPNLKVVNHIQSRWVGQCTWPPMYGTHPETLTPEGTPTTFIELQKYICHDERTVRRILAHELCHHEEFFVGFNVSPRERRTRRRIEGTHGATWWAIVARWNAKYGKDFITQTSDEADVKVHDDKTFWMYLIKEPTRVLWQSSVSLTPKALRYMLSEGTSPTTLSQILATGQKPNRKLCTSNDRDFLIRNGTIGDGWYSKKEPEIAAKAAELYETGVDLFKKEVTDVLQQSGETTKVIKPFYVIIHKQNYGSQNFYWQQASTLNDEQKSRLALYARRVARGAEETKVVMSTSPVLKGGGRFGTRSFTWPRTELEKTALDDAWNNGKNIVEQFAPPTPPKTAAPASDTMKGQIYYHGTGSEAAAQAILQSGIQPRDITMPDKAKSRAQLAPVPDRVYLTTSMGYASLYAMGGQMFGAGLHDQTQTNYTAAQWLKNNTKEGDYGYIFEIHGRQLTGDVVPDEDSIGEAISWLVSDIEDTRLLAEINRTGKETYKGQKAGLERSLNEYVKKQPINQPGVPQSVRDELYNLYNWKASDRTKQRIEEVAYQAELGKKLQKVLSQETCNWMLEHGAHVAHRGTIIPTHCQRFSKEKALYTKNLSEILEEVPIPAQAKTASPDFGYSTYNDREKDLKNVKISLVGKTPRGEGDIQVIAEYDGRQIGGIDCWKVTRLCTMNGIYIEGDWRGTGLGQMLYDAAIQAAKKAGCRYFVSDGQLRDDAVSAWQRLAKRYRVEEIDNPEYLDGAEEEDEDAEDGYSAYDNGEVDQHPVRYQIDLNSVPLKAKKAAEENSGDPFWEAVKTDLLAGIVYHGTTVEIAEIIQRTGFRGLDFDTIVQDVLAKYGMTDDQIPKNTRKALEGTKRSYEHENGTVSTCPGGYMAVRYAGDGGEVALQVEAFVRGKWRNDELPYSLVKGDPAVIKCRIKNFEGSDNYRRAVQVVEGLTRWFTEVGESDRRRTPRKAAEDTWLGYTNFLCKPEDLEVISVITGSQLEQLAKAPLGVTSE